MLGSIRTRTAPAFRYSCSRHSYWDSVNRKNSVSRIWCRPHFSAQMPQIWSGSNCWRLCSTPDLHVELMTLPVAASRRSGPRFSPQICTPALWHFSLIVRYITGTDLTSAIGLCSRFWCMLHNSELVVYITKKAKNFRASLAGRWLDSSRAVPLVYADTVILQCSMNVIWAHCIEMMELHI
jgi:hypothetical protein